MFNRKSFATLSPHSDSVWQDEEIPVGYATEINEVYYLEALQQQEFEHNEDHAFYD
jgi:hypothetical protein